MEESTQDITKPTNTGYDSNPFTATWTALQKLVKHNAQTVVGVAFFNILLTVILILNGFAVFFAVAAFIIKHNNSFGTNYSGSVLSFLTSMSDVSIYLTWGIGLVVGLFVGMLIQSLQLNLTVASARNVTLKFGALLKQSARTVLPLLGLVGLFILVMVLGWVVLALLSLVLGLMTFVIALIVFAGFIYAALRLGFAQYIIVDQHLGPVAALKQSWKITEGHIIEAIGSASVASLILIVPAIIMDALARVTEGVPLLSGLFGLLNGAIVTVLIVAAGMALAERYVQVHAVANKKLEATALSPFNYLAIVVVLILVPILNALSPRTDSSPQDPWNGGYGLPLQNDASDTYYDYNTQLN